ncbi:galactoside 2-alpha-L-fucosyltransferase-like [Salvia hispanica]|uniref:galactoside 2-alpha-L-fucosyltransferase-like n=1 Tax=Salvia hispanica TaxID=49212 RepID=UPI00200959BA|nr:galactoside 2-alpha-L-fucosyltransferase-like [Salvia hispanica]XP_047969617.1 galactoside 2-alpha-L-fucosyltransferase-like [Salvia hispanica]
MKRPNGRAISANGGATSAPERKCGFNPMNLMGVLAALVMALSVLFSVSVVLRDPPSDGLWTVVEARNLDFAHHQKAILEENSHAQPVEVPKDKLLGDLLPSGFDERSCQSRYQSLLYRRGVPQKASSYLISKLRSYEARHKKCGPYTSSYNKTVEDLKSGRHSSTPECNYLVWISFSGLGNRILTLASAFLYALLTDRVLLVDRGVDIHDLFCEPFPEASWLLPLDFPLTNEFSSFNQGTHQSYGSVVKSNSTESAPRPYMYLHLLHDYDDQDKLFFCDQDQAHLQRIPWLVMKSDNYFVPSLFLMPSFAQELHSLFPDKDSVFHFLGRYLFHPTNTVWGLISRYHEAYLSKADVTVGIQVRVFDVSPGPFKHILDQVLSCTTRENILPEVSQQEGGVVGSSTKQKTRVSVLITSLTSGYFEQIRDLYWENPTTAGEVVAVFQPSNEMLQQSEKQNHNRKAWAEMYLLSLTDKLVTSSWSTFGYVAQGLGGVKPWILHKSDNHTVPDPPCRRAMSMEPCFHAPPFYDCKTRRGIDTGAVVPHVRHCEDMSWGLKLFQHHSQ